LTKEKLFQLIIAFRDGSITKSDFFVLQSFVKSDAAEPWLEEILDTIGTINSSDELSDVQSEQMFANIISTVNVVNNNKNKKRLRKLCYAVATAAAVLFAVFYFYSSQFKQATVNIAHRNQEILPGRAKGNLLLDNGEIINLEQLSADTSIVQKGYTIIKDKMGGISYTLTDKKNTHTLYNTIVTPKGGEYKLCLPDGTRIWVNASSKIRYPLNFGEMKREVELEGEALFEVAKVQVGKRHIPFIVKTRTQSLQVLGTTFNINSYETMIHTTLVEGSVRLAFNGKKQQVLKPNEQANFDEINDNVLVKTIDPFYTIAWRNGSFAFDNTELQEVMNTIARWYDVEIIYQENVKDIRFSGTISRNADIKKLLNLITLTGGVNFEMKERRIIVKK